MTAVINARFRFYVRRGRRIRWFGQIDSAPWIVVDRQTDSVAAEFESREEARGYVKARNDV